MTNCDFLNIGFIGFGLIGGSIAKAIKAAHPEYHIIVESRKLSHLSAQRVHWSAHSGREGQTQTAGFVPARHS